jgi:hypothetical protein
MPANALFAGSLIPHATITAGAPVKRGCLTSSIAIFCARPSEKFDVSANPLDL